MMAAGSVLERLPLPGQAKLDVHGRIMRYGQPFSVAGIFPRHEGDEDPILPPPGTTTEDWNIFVSPRVVGDEEPTSEGDNALLKFECWAVENTSHTQWTIHVKYKYKVRNDSGETGSWSPKPRMDKPSVNWILIPK